jgi:protocatechuate 3,4-dioxygenase beta subunit
MRNEPTDHSHGDLASDMELLMRQATRRRAVNWLAGAAGLALTGGALAQSRRGRPGSGSTGGNTGGNTGGTSGGTGNSSCPLIAEETAGPYPGDGSNGNGSGVANALLLSGIVRSDIRSSIAGATGVAGGVPMTVQLKLVNTNGSCASLEGYAIYLWHCDREGRYSMYSSGVTAENYLRGVQATDANGLAAFTTIVPGCYSGRMPHMHFEVYRSLSTATQFSNKLRTSQIAFPTDVCNTVYTNATGYTASATNFARISFATDNVFSDGTSTEMATVSGSMSTGYTAVLQVPISV